MKKSYAGEGGIFFAYGDAERTAPVKAPITEQPDYDLAMKAFYLLKEAAKQTKAQDRSQGGR